jgi:hypothetical protein
MRRLLWANLLATLRNPMALIYGWLFPLIFLAGFWALYGDDPLPLALHAGQFFTITILGSAAFGLPTQMVAEREAGLWRHMPSHRRRAGVLCWRWCWPAPCCSSAR